MVCYSSNYILLRNLSRTEGKVIPVTGRGGPYSCETLRLTYILDNRLTDWGEVVSLTRQQRFIPRTILRTHFC
jgi:hypothetical protein